MFDLNDLGASIKSRRRAKGFSQQQVGDMSGMSRARIEALENGRAADVGVKNLLKIMNIVGLDLRVTEYNRTMPTLEDLIAEREANPHL